MVRDFISKNITIKLNKSDFILFLVSISINYTIYHNIRKF